jgi:DNA replicative helicase MCM subunit Mcm2 (Cdc46/Mcm family)
MYPKPVACDATPDCPGREFQLQELDPRDQDHRDYQEIKVQEQLHQLNVGSMPRSVHVILMEDLVDVCKAGDDITINGIVSRRWRQFGVDERCDLEMIIVANHLKVNNEHKLGLGMTEELKQEFEKFWQDNAAHPLKGRDYILKSICPDVFGMSIVKLSIGLVVAGGVQRRTKDGTKVRGESHLLLVGDPGTGKSQILKFAAKMATRSVVTTGIGTTGAGLTVTAVKDKGGEWVLEAGALVLADGGICCIDEFNSMQEHDRTTIHEAMEQQTLSIAKAGLVCKLQTRCSIIGATNTKGKYDPNEALTANVSIHGPLLSRFDIVIVMVDGQDRQWDARLADFILENRQKTTALIALQQQEQSLRKEQEGFRRGEKRSVWQQQKPNDGSEEQEPKVKMDHWGVDKLQAYFSYIRTTYAPTMSDDARELLTRYYTKQRNTDNADKSRTTIRMLESLIRLSEAHAKLMFRNQTVILDAVVAIYVMEAAMGGSATIIQCPPSVQSMFHDDPDLFFDEIQVKVLNALGLTHLDEPRAPRPSSGSELDFGEQITPPAFMPRANAFGGTRAAPNLSPSPESGFGTPEVASDTTGRKPSEEWGRASVHSQYSQQHRNQAARPVQDVLSSSLQSGDVPATPPGSNMHSTQSQQPPPQPATPKQAPVAPARPVQPTPPKQTSAASNQVFSPPWKRFGQSVAAPTPSPSVSRPAEPEPRFPAPTAPIRQPPPPKPVAPASVPPKIAPNSRAKQRDDIVKDAEPEPTPATASVATDDLIGDIDWGMDEFG